MLRSAPLCAALACSLAGAAAARDLKGLSCPAPAPESVVDAMSSGRLAYTEGLYRALIEYQRCAAYSKGDDDVCDALARLPDGGAKGYDPRAVCEDHVRDMRLARMLVARDEAFIPYCVKAGREKELKEFTGADPAKVCRVIFDRFPEPETLEDGLRPFLQDPQALSNHFMPMMRVLHGDEAALAQYKDKPPMRRDRVAGYLRFARAFAAGDKARCEGDTVCLLMMGETGAVCDAPLRTLRSEACPLPAPERAEVEALERRAAALDDRCRRSLTPEALAKEVAKPETLSAGQARAVAVAVENEALAYFKYKAFAHEDPKLCAPLKAWSIKTDNRGQAPGDFLCRDLFRRRSFVRGYVENRPDVKELCFANVVNETPGTPQDANYRKSCDIIVRRDLPPSQLCEQAISLMPFPPETRGKHLRRCVCDFSSMNGARRCADDPGNNPLGFLGPKRYDSLFRFFLAREKKDWTLCGGLDLCEALMGRASQSADIYARRIAEKACPVYDRQDPKFAKLSSAAQKSLSRLDEALNAPDLSDARRSELRQLRARLEPLAEPAPPVVGAVAPVRPPGLCNGFTMDSMVDFMARGALPMDAPLMRSAVEFYRCRAVAHDDPALCSPLKTLPGADKKGYDTSEICRSQYQEIRGARDRMLGDAAAAPAVPDPVAVSPLSRELSVDYAAFSKASRAGGADACGGSTVCRLMLGGGDDLCLRYQTDAERLACPASAER